MGCLWRGGSPHELCGSGARSSPPRSLPGQDSCPYPAGPALSPAQRRAAHPLRARGGSARTWGGGGGGRAGRAAAGLGGARRPFLSLSLGAGSWRT